MVNSSRGYTDNYDIIFLTKLNETSKPQLIGSLWGNPPVTGGFTSQETYNAESWTEYYV